HFTITGPIAEVLRVDATTNFTAWTPLATLTNFTGVIQFTDTTSPSFSRRFYRVSLLSAGPVLLSPIRLSNGLQFTIYDAPGQAFRIQAASNLLNWTTIATLTNTTGTLTFTDPAATNLASRFYRAAVP